MFNLWTALAISASLSAAAAAPAAAETAALSNATTSSAEEIAQMRVVVGDLNLGSERGAAQALRRIRHASDAFCGVEHGNRDLKRTTLARSCARTMTSRAVGELNAPRVTARYEKTSSPTVFASSR